MDPEEPRPGEGGRDSPVSRLERALRTGSWRGAPRPRRDRPAIPPAPPPRRRHLRKRILAALLLLVLIAVIAAVIAAPRLLDRGELTVLVLGASDAADQPPDSIMFLRADLASGQVALLSVPADIWITGADGRGHQAGALLEEPDGLAQLTRRLYLVTPQYRITLPADGLPKLVNAVGGVDVDVGPRPVNAYDEAAGWHLHLLPGKQHLHGEQAAAYLRYRTPQAGPCPICGATWNKAEGEETGELARIARRQAVLRAVLAKLRGAGVLWRAPRVLWAARRVEHNLTFRQVLALGNSLRRSPVLEFATYPTESQGRRLLPSPERAARLEGPVRGILAGRVTVRNGAGSPGLAGRVATLLARKGFLVLPPENAARAAHTTIEGPAELSREVQQALGYGSCAYQDSKDVVVTIGLDAPSPE
jgi:anionic cell wall polymer biosynthesis LytR-Cps2A-Psr (LCP) family protein